jgi:hypothetical protein
MESILLDDLLCIYLSCSFWIERAFTLCSLWYTHFLIHLLCTHSLRGDFYDCECTENQSVQNQAQSARVEESRMKTEKKSRREAQTKCDMFEWNKYFVFAQTLCGYLFCEELN